MPQHVFLLLLLFCLILSLAWFWHFYRLHHVPPHPRAVAVHPMVHRLLKPRSPHDCPACCLASTLLSGEESALPPVRPWCDVKSRRGAPKRLNTEGFACPNRKCPYSGITDADTHTLVGDGKHGHAERIQTFRCQACRTTFSARRDTPLYRLKAPASRVGEVLTALCEGPDVAATGRVFEYHPNTVTAWLTRALEQSTRLHHRPCSTSPS